MPGSREMVAVDARTILRSTGCDLKKLPLGAREAFFLMQLDGQLTLEEIASISGMNLGEAGAIASRLVRLGAVALLDPITLRRGPKLSTVHGSPRVERAAPRVDPRAEESTARVDPRAEVAPESRRRSIAPRPEPKRALTPRPERKRSRKSLQHQSAVVAPPVDEACELDEATLARITTMVDRVGKVDFYVLLDVEPDAEKKAIKRAYYALAAVFHPDRFFGKKLGPARKKIDRVFHAITEAHDTLTSHAGRVAYDATLPPRSKPPVSTPKRSLPPVSARKSIVPSRRSSRAMRAPSRTPEAVAPPVSKRLSRRPSQKLSLKPAPSEKPVRSEKPTISQGPISSPKSGPTSAGRAQNLRAAALELTIHAKVDALIKAAEDSLRKEDVIGAANNYRLALAHRDDLYLRIKYDEVDARARVIRYEKNIEPARIAERDHRWSDAAVFLQRAHDARPAADIAARAAHALRLGGGDLDRATLLAEQAVSLDDASVAHRVTLGEVHLAANRVERAEKACEEALARAPKDARAKELAAAIAKKSKHA